MRDLAALAEGLQHYARDVISVVDADGVVQFISDAALLVLGQPAAQAEGTASLSWVHPDDVAYAQEQRAWLLAEPGRSQTTVLRVVSPTGWRHMETTGVNLLGDPGIEGVLYISRDIEERFEQAAALERAVVGQRLVADLGRRALTTESVSELIDHALSELSGLIGASAITLGGLPGQRRQRLRLPENGQEPIQASPGHFDPQIVPVVGPHGELGHLVIVPGQALLSELELEVCHGVASVLACALVRSRREEQALTAALHDPLTGLATRTLFDERLERTLARPGRRCAVLVLDLDGFKNVNDTYGHLAGDEVLRTLGPRLLRCTRPTDTVARYGGDEFVVLCEDASDEQALTQLAERIRLACSVPFPRSGGGSIRLSGSVGVAVCSESVRTADELLAVADAEMYAVKHLPL